MAMMRAMVRAAHINAERLPAKRHRTDADTPSIAVTASKNAVSLFFKSFIHPTCIPCSVWF